MTSLEGVPRMAVVVADLHVGVTDGSCGLPLLTRANGTLMHGQPCSQSSLIMVSEWVPPKSTIL